jgi:membrane associated rhomboid family serine protease
MPRYQLSSRSLSVWQFLSYAFLHLGWLHLLFNMVVLYILGNAVNDRLGHVGYLAFYLSGAVFAAIGFVITGGEAVVGASGAVGAVMGAYLVLLPKSNITLFIGIGWIEVPSMYFVIIFFCYNLVMSVALRVGVQHVAYEAHIAGMLFGFVITMALLLSGLAARQQFDLLALMQRWNRRRLYRSLVRNGYDPFAVASAKPVQPTSDQPDLKAIHAATLRAQAIEAAAERNLPLAARYYRELKSIAPDEPLPRQNQLDVANQLAEEQRYHDAASAYEQFLKHYPGFEQIEQVQLMLGLIYARYLARYQRARECLAAALLRLQDQPKLTLAREELARIQGFDESSGRSV